MFKWGLFKKDLSDTELPAELKRQMNSLHAKYSGTDQVVLVMDQLCRVIREQQEELENNVRQVKELEQQGELNHRTKTFQADLLISMCDEIQAPIHTLNQLGDWLDQTHLDSNQRSCFNFYRKTARKLNGLFNHVIDVAKMREGLLHPDPISFHLSKVVREIMETPNLTAQDKGVPLTVQIDPDVPQYLIGDPKRLEQILVSLVNNAIKFTYEGEVQVQVKLEADERTECTLKFLVEDSGIGLPENHIDTLFDRLSQGDPDVERNYGGTGLGLYICKCFVEQMGGSIWARNRPEGGALFGFSICFEKGSLEEIVDTMLSLPQQTPTKTSDHVKNAAEVRPAGSADTQPAVSESSNGHSDKMKILVVDDCSDTCRMIEKFLEEEAFEVHVVHDGLAALESYNQGGYDLILMDIQLPQMDGVVATMEIRNKESGQEAIKTPIFALVGDPGEDNDGYYQAGDFDRCLIKPVSKDDLLKAIQTLPTPR